MTPANAPRPRGEDVEALLGIEPLKVGDHVRVKLSGECAHNTQGEWLNGRTGSIINPRPWTLENPEPVTHPHLVQLDGISAFSVDSTWWCSRWELSRLP